MIRKTMTAAALVLTIALPFGAQAADYITNAKAIVKATDWKKMETVKVIIGERGQNLFYRPSKLVFKVGQPYKLQLVNKGKKKHYFTSEKFYKAIATRKVQANKMGEIKAPYFSALEMNPKGGQLDVYFVPVTKGVYEVECTIDDHKERGMVGSITIE